MIVRRGHIRGAEVRRTAARRLAREERRPSGNPKSLILALMEEVGELADVLLYLLRVADVLEVDAATAARAKMAASHMRFAAGDVCGRAPKKA